MSLEYLKNVVTLRIDPSRCSGCGMCATVCPHPVFRIQDGKAHIVNLDLCMECGACAKNCAENALTVRAGVGCATRKAYWDRAQLRFLSRRMRIGMD